MRKCLRIEVDRNKAQYIRDLVTEAKAQKLFAPMWGRNVTSRISDGLVGVANLNKPVSFYSVSNQTNIACHMTLQHVLYNYVKLTDGYALCAELYHLSALSSVYLVISNMPEAKRIC